MPLTNPNKIVTEERLSEFYGQILPYMGGMPEVLANKFSKGDLYSTDEKMIGQWIDGKPLYQKTVTTGGNVPSGATLIQRTTQTGYDTILYTKTTDSPIAIGSDTDYSTDEKIVGTWIDGKPLYQRLYYSDDITITSSWQELPLNLPRTNNPIVFMKYGFFIKNDGEIFPLPYANTGDYLITYSFTATGNISIKSGSKRTGDLYFIVNYTKTTDV